MEVSVEPLIPLRAGETLLRSDLALADQALHRVVERMHALAPARLDVGRDFLRLALADQRAHSRVADQDLGGRHTAVVVGLLEEYLRHHRLE